MGAKNFSHFMTARRKGCILKALLDAHADANDSKAAADLVQSYLISIGFSVSRQQVLDDLKWMADAGLLLRDVIDGKVFVRITPLGRDCANGHGVVVAGVDMSERDE